MEAVENINTFSSFKEYMHVERPVQNELWSLIQNAMKSQQSQLILVCGSVGDGKSHLLSYLCHCHPEIRDHFYIHNDATESFDPQKTSMDTLNDVLNGFSDEELESDAVHKVLIAINLGTLNNFIESVYQHQFTKLREFVLHHSIIETEVSDFTYDSNSVFQFINFSDYHMYSLSDERPVSSYIQQLLQRIVQSTETNLFYLEYLKSCKQCQFNEKCPVQSNYEMLSSANFQDGLIQLIIQAIVKQKLIISTRDLLNFIYDAITCGATPEVLFQDLPKKWTLERLQRFIYMLTPMGLFEHPDLSYIFKTLQSIDPAQIRSQELDHEFVHFYMQQMVTPIFEKHMHIDQMPYIKMLIQQIDELVQNSITKNKIKEIKTFMVKMFIRVYSFAEKKIALLIEDEIYQQYMKDLYYSNVGNKLALKSIYKSTKEAIYGWDGNSESESMRLQSSTIHNRYRISELIPLKPYLIELCQRSEEILDKFIPLVHLQFIKEGAEKPVEIYMDYSLYHLVYRLNHGYKPNHHDRYQYIHFDTFIKHLTLSGRTAKELLFEEQSRGKTVKYKLTYDPDFEDYEFTVIL